MERDGVEEGVEAALEEAELGLVADHAVGLAGAGDAVGEEEAVLADEQVLDEREADVLEQLLLRGRLVEYLAERVHELLDLTRAIRGRTLFNHLNATHIHSLV